MKSFGEMLTSNHPRTPYRKSFWTPALAFTPHSQKFFGSLPFALLFVYLRVPLHEACYRVPGRLNLTLAMLKVASSNDRGLLEQAAGRDVKSEPDELGVCPGQRSS
jgi:hypothetical protein